LIITNIWIIYHTKSGNCGSLCEDIAERLKGEYDIRTDEVKEINPVDISNQPPKENNVAKEILSDYLEFKIQDTGKMSGPPEPGQEPKIDEFIIKVRNFIEQ